MKNTFEKLLITCYEEQSPQFVNELSSIEANVARTEDYLNGIDEIIETASIFSDELELDTQNKIQNIYEESLESF